MLPPLWVPAARQWLSTTACRVAGDGYSWMQAVHWVASSGLYTPRRRTGPRTFDRTTLRVAQLCAELSPCRPGVDYLVRRTGLSERTVKYHLAMLREAGLLAYVERGTRVRGAAARASEFALVVPPQFDEALGIRTIGDGPGRRVTGIDGEAGRKLVAKLGRKAARKVRSTSRRSLRKASGGPVRPSGTTGQQGSSGAVAGRARCTPMRGGCSTSSAAGTTWFPSENKLASGASESATPKKPKRTASGRKSLNQVGRRFQLAAELVAQVPWLRGEAVPQVAWVVRHLADAGWSAVEVQAWLETTPAPDRGSHRPAGLLAYRVRGVEQHVDTAAKRQVLVERWEASREAARRHRIRQVRARQERAEGDWQAPLGRAVRREVESVFAAAVQRPAQSVPDAYDSAWQDGLDGIGGMSAAERAELVDQAWGEWMVGDTTLVTSMLTTLGRGAAVAVFGSELVRRVLRFEAGGVRRRLSALGRR